MSATPPEQSPGEILLAVLDATLVRAPRSPSARFERAKLLDALGRAEQAEAAYHAVLDERPGHFRALNDLGLLYNRFGLTNESLACFRAATEAAPDNAIGHANLGAMLLNANDFAGARTHFARALALRPSFTAARQGLAAALERLGLDPAGVPALQTEAPIEQPPASATTPQASPFDEQLCEIGAGMVLDHDDDAAEAFLEHAVAAADWRVMLLWRVAEAALTQRRHALATRILERALALEPENAELHLSLAIACEEAGDEAAARAKWESPALRGIVRRYPFTGNGPPIRVLTIASALHAMRYTLFVDPALMQNTTLYTQAYAEDQPLPEHDVVLNAIADVESDEPALEVARRIVARTTAPVVNHPERVLRTARDAQAERLRALADVRTAGVFRVSRERVRAAGAAQLEREYGLRFPLLVRSPGFHNGRYFELVEDERAWPAALDSLASDDVLMLSFVDTRGADGLFRKLRVMTIGGRLYPLHLAISPSWKVHYVSSAMSDDQAYRREEATFLSDMPGYLGPRVVAALERVAAVTDLDYGGIDFGLTPSGELVVFEANGAMAIFLPDDDPRWDYRRPAMNAALDAAKTMLVNRARQAAPSA